MRFVVFGAGAIGGLLGARLAQSGRDVLLVARGAHAAAIRAHGLRVEDPDRSATVELPVATSAADLRLGAEDVVLLATKSQDTEEALRGLVGVAPPEIPVACVQNGVANERAASRYFERVYAVCVLCPAEHLEPGVVVGQSAPVSGLLDLGRYPRGVDAVAEGLAEAFRAATFEAEPRSDVMAWKHRKLILNLGNGVEAACAPGSGRRELVELVRHEGERVLSAAGIEVVTAEQDAARRADLLTVREVAGRPRGGSSTWQSLARGTGTVETDYLNGEIVLMGRLHGVETPANALVQRTVRRLALDRGAPGSLSARALVGQLREPS